MTTPVSNSAASAMTVAVFMLFSAICGVASAKDSGDKESEHDFLREMAGRLAIIERRIDYLDENLERTMDMRERPPPGVRVPRSSSRTLSTREGDFGTSGDEYTRTRLKLDRLRKKARDAERQLDKHETTHVGQGDAADEDKAGKSRRKIELRIAQIENDIEELERESRYVR